VDGGDFAKEEKGTVPGETSTVVVRKGQTSSMSTSGSYRLRGQELKRGGGSLWRKVALLKRRRKGEDGKIYPILSKPYPVKNHEQRRLNPRRK